MILAEAGESDFANPLTWVQFGVLGLVVLGFLTGWIHARPSVERLERERDRLLTERDEFRDQRDAMAHLFQEKALPVLGDFLAVTRALLPALQDVARERRDPR